MTARRAAAPSLALALAFALAFAGCIDNYASVRLYGLCFPPTPTDTGGCAYPATCETLLLGTLVVDVSNGSPDGALIWPIQVDNKRPVITDQPGGTDPAIAWVTDFTLTYSSASVAVPEVTIPSPENHPVPANGSSVLIVPLVPPSVATSLAAQIGAGQTVEIAVDVRAKGHYGDSTTFETGPFRVVVSAGDGNLGAPVCPADKPVWVGACPQAGQTSVDLCTTAP
jgi:hypothetical protein